MYRKNQHIGAHKAPYSKQRKQGVDNPATQQDIRYTPTPVQDIPLSRATRSRLESENRNWMLQDKGSGQERHHSPDSALTLSSNGSSHSLQRGLQSAPRFMRSQSIPNLFESIPPFHPDQSTKMSDSPHRTNSISVSGPRRDQGPVDVHQGPFVRVKVGPYDDRDAGRGIVESSSLVRNRFKSESNLFDPEVNTQARHIEQRQPFSVRTIEMKKMLGMFGFVLSCKYVLQDPMVPRELRSFPRIDTVSVEGVAHRSGIQRGHFVLEINGQSVELSSLNRCTSLLQQGGDNLRLKIASNHHTNEPVDTHQRMKGTAWSNAAEDVLPITEIPRHRVRHREPSALQKRLMSSHPTGRMKRADSTPNLVDDERNHIYEELTDPLPDAVAFTKTPPTGTGRRGSDTSKSGKRPGIATPQKNQTGRTDTTHGHPSRIPTNTPRNVGGSNVDMDVTSRKSLVDLEGVSFGGLPPSPPPRPFPQMGEVIPGRSLGWNPAAAKTGGKRNDPVGRAATPSVVGMKISPGAGIASISSVSALTSSASETPVKFSSFTGPFKDDASNVDATHPTGQSHDSGRIQENGGCRGLSTLGPQINVTRMQVAENGRSWDTPLSRYPGNNTSRTVATEDSGHKEIFGSRSNLLGVMATMKNGSAGSRSLAMDMAGPGSNNAALDSKAPGEQGGRSEFRSSQNHLENQRTPLTRKEEPLSLLEAIKQHPLMRSERSTLNKQENSTVTSQSHETIAKHEPQKIPPLIPPPPKPKAQKNVVLEGVNSHGPSLEGTNSLTQTMGRLAIAPDIEAKNQRTLKPVAQDFRKGNDPKVQPERAAEANQRGHKQAQRQVSSPPALKTHQRKGHIALKALTKQGVKSKADQSTKSKCITPIDSRNPRQDFRFGSHPNPVLHLDGATVDQSYSEDNGGNRHGQQIKHPIAREGTQPEPVFRFDVSTGRLLLSDATVDQSSTESDLLPFVPPPPPMIDFTSSESRLSEIQSQEPSWIRRLEGSSCVTSPFVERSISLESDSVFLQGIGSPPPPAIFVDSDENSEIWPKRDFRSNPPTTSAPDLHPKAEQGVVSRRPASGTHLPNLHSKSDQKSVPSLFGPRTDPSGLRPKTDQESIPRRFGLGTHPPDLYPKTDQVSVPRRFGPAPHPPQAADPTRAPLPPLEFQGVLDVAPQTNRHFPEPPAKTQSGKPNGAARRQLVSESSVGDWSSSDVADWLRQIGLGQHAATFVSHHVDGRRLSGMTRGELIELGVTEMTQRRDIERGVLRLKSLIDT